MINYSKFSNTENHAFNLYNAIKYCKDNNENGIVFDKGVYDLYPEMACEDALRVSNHDMYGFYRIAFLLKNMKGFTIDGGDSEFVFHGSITPIVIENCENITIKNLSIDYKETMTLDTEVVGVGEGFFDLRVVNDDKYKIHGNMLYYYNEYGNEDIFHYFCLRSLGDDKSFIPETTDEFRVFNPKIRFDDLGDKKIRVYNSGIKVKVGMHVLTRGTERFACNILATDSKDIFVENVTMYKSYAMGLIAQKTENVFVDNMTVKAKDDALFSLNCDATHFVHCKGLVKVTNSTFSEQQDDALNINGIFTRIIDKTDDYIIIKYMHKSAKGLDIYKKGDEIAVLNPKTLIPSGHYKISDVEIINMNYTKLYIEGGTENISVGDDVEDLTWSCDLIFENNRVFNNRARGMLIAAKGKVEIRNNYFNTPGVAILFESDGAKWYESGGTTDVRITNNIFEHCKYVNGRTWGSHVIEVKPREEFNEGNYYHKYISVADNEFKNCPVPLIYADNVQTVEFRGNKIQDSNEDLIFKNCGEIVRG